MPPNSAALLSLTLPQVLKESGPPHMKSFLTRVTVGDYTAEGEGNSKKLSKKRAALSVLQDLKKLPFIPVVEKPKIRCKKRPKTILKVRTPEGRQQHLLKQLKRSISTTSAPSVTWTPAGPGQGAWHALNRHQSDLVWP